LRELRENLGGPLCRGSRISSEHIKKTKKMVLEFDSFFGVKFYRGQWKKTVERGD
jgi:hypothetical protein